MSCSNNNNNNLLTPCQANNPHRFEYDHHGEEYILVFPKEEIIKTKVIAQFRLNIVFYYYFLFKKTPTEWH